MTPPSLGEGTVFKPNGEDVCRANCHFLSASSRPILFRVMSPVFFNTSRYNTLRWVALQFPELKCVATAVSFLSRTSERCMFILFLKESPVSPTYNLLHFEKIYAVNTVSWITIVCGRNLNFIPASSTPPIVLPLSTTTCVEHNSQFLVVHLWQDPLFEFFQSICWLVGWLVGWLVVWVGCLGWLVLWSGWELGSMVWDR